VIQNSLNNIFNYVGNTPLYQLQCDNINLFAKLEYFNFTGSIKDRPAFQIIFDALSNGQITTNSTVIESSSGNFAVALATICSCIKIKFIAVIDPNISSSYENILKLIAYKVIKVDKLDETGGYLLTRIDTVKSICRDDPGMFWTNQYENPNNYLSYYNGLGLEICNSFETLDYAFIGVSTGGTITGISIRLKERFPNIKVIAVDVEGSVIFGGKAKKRFISGIGASITSPLLKKALIDQVMYVTHQDIIEGCEVLLHDHMIFAGGSTGAVYSAITKYFADKNTVTNKPNVIFLCTDKGNAYLDSIYSTEWNKNLSDRL